MDRALDAAHEIARELPVPDVGADEHDALAVLQGAKNVFRAGDVTDEGERLLPGAERDAHVVREVVGVVLEDGVNPVSTSEMGNAILAKLDASL